VIDELLSCSNEIMYGDALYVDVQMLCETFLCVSSYKDRNGAKL
jgi:hypothetical protein